MYSHSDIQDAVEAGALTAEQAASLRNHVASRTGTPTPDEEHVRMLQGFNDLYVYASSIVLLIGLGWLGSKVETGGRAPSFVMPLLVALASWGLAEWFGRKKRLALTAITLAWVFVYAVFFTIMLLAAQMLEFPDRGTQQLVMAVASALGAGAAFLHWKRFGEPVAISLILLMAASTVTSLIGLVMPRDPDGTVSSLVMILLGLATLFYAQTWEAKDIHRTTKQADIGFWLHLAAASEITIGVAGLLGLMTGNISQGAAIGAIVVFLVMALIGIVLDRRIYVLCGAWLLGIGIHTLIRGDPMSAYGGEYGSSYGYSPYGMGGGDSVDNIMLTVLIVGVVLVVLGMFWTQIRGTLGGLAGPLAGKVPPARAQDAQGKAFE